MSFLSCVRVQNQCYVGAAHKPQIFKFRENQMREIQEVPVITLRLLTYILSKNLAYNFLLNSERLKLFARNMRADLKWDAPMINCPLSDHDLVPLLKE